MREVLTIASLTWREASRQRILPICFALGLLFLVLYAFFANSIPSLPTNLIVRREFSKVLLSIGLYAVSWLSGMTIVVASADSLPGEISTGVLQTIASKPIARWKIFVGKWLAFASIAACYIAFMALGCCLAVYELSDYWPRYYLRGYALIWLESLLLMTITFAVGVRVSTLAAGATAIGLHGITFLGGWMEVSVGLLEGSGSKWVGLVTSLILPSEALWRRAAYEIQRPILLGLGAHPFDSATVPSGLMIAYALLYIGVLFAWGLRGFARRDL